MYENTESWETTVPADLIPAVKHLRKPFDEAHWGFGWTTQRLRYPLLHDQVPDDPERGGCGGEFAGAVGHLQEATAGDVISVVSSIL